MKLNFIKEVNSNIYHEMTMNFDHDIHNSRKSNIFVASTHFYELKILQEIVILLKNLYFFFFSKKLFYEEKCFMKVTFIT